MGLYAVTPANFNLNRNKVGSQNFGVPGIANYAPQPGRVAAHSGPAPRPGTSASANTPVATKPAPRPGTTASNDTLIPSNRNQPKAKPESTFFRDWYDDAVTPALARSRTSSAMTSLTDAMAPVLAWDQAQRGLTPYMNEINNKIALNNNDYAAQVAGFNTQRAQLDAEYQNALAQLKLNGQGRQDDRWLMDEQLKLKQQYFDRLAAMYQDQSGIQNRQIPLIQAQKGDNEKLWTLANNQADRDKADAGATHERNIFGLHSAAATNAGWENKGTRMGFRLEDQGYQNMLGSIADSLAKARIDKDANDRSLTEKEQQVQDQLRQIQRDTAQNQDDRVNNYLQYLHDVATIGRKEAEDRLREKEAADQRRFTAELLANQQLRAQISNQRQNSDLEIERINAQNNANAESQQYLGVWKNILTTAAEDPKFRGFVKWTYDEAIRKGASHDDAIRFIVNYYNSGQPMVRPNQGPGLQGPARDIKLR